MSNREKKDFERFCFSMIVQGPHYRDNIKEILKILYKSIREEFNEDGCNTLENLVNEILQEVFTESRNESLLRYKREALSKLTDQQIMELKI